MLVDDDADDQEIFLYALRDINLPVLCLFARDGREALRKLADAVEMPDYIFLDLNMAPMDGRSCLTALKADPRTREEMLRLGASGYWVKDVSVSRLSGWLRSLLEEPQTV